MIFETITVSSGAEAFNLSHSVCIQNEIQVQRGSRACSLERSCDTLDSMRFSQRENRESTRLWRGEREREILGYYRLIRNDTPDNTMRGS